MPQAHLGPVQLLSQQQQQHPSPQQLASSTTPFQFSFDLDYSSHPLPTHLLRSTSPILSSGHLNNESSSSIDPPSTTQSQSQQPSAPTPTPWTHTPNNLPLVTPTGASLNDQFEELYQQMYLNALAQQQQQLAAAAAAAASSSLSSMGSANAASASRSDLLNMKPAPICRYYLQGRCYAGTTCRFRHPTTTPNTNIPSNCNVTAAAAAAYPSPGTTPPLSTSPPRTPSPSDYISNYLPTSTTTLPHPLGIGLIDGVPAQLFFARHKILRPPCRYWHEGKCVYGMYCRFGHY